METTNKGYVATLKRRRRLQAEGLCFYCGKRPSTVGPRGGMRDLCDACRESQKQSSMASNRRRVERRKRDGLCIVCGTVPPVMGHVFCETCKAIRYASRARSDAKRHQRFRDAGLCIYCGKRPLVNKSECVECRETRHERERIIRQRANAGSK